MRNRLRFGSNSTIEEEGNFKPLAVQNEIFTREHTSMIVKSIAQNLLNEYGQDLFPLGRNWESTILQSTSKLGRDLELPSTLGPMCKGHTYDYEILEAHRLDSDGLSRTFPLLTRGTCVGHHGWRH
jgi:hypothetical protein